MNRINLAPLLVSMLAVSSAWADTLDKRQEAGAYVGAAIGRTSFSTKGLGLPKVGSDESAQASKVYGGYRFSDRLASRAAMCAWARRWRS
jgi:OmpA-OmpF porin, OOP family